MVKAPSLPQQQTSAILYSSGAAASTSSQHNTGIRRVKKEMPVKFQTVRLAIFCALLVISLVLAALMLAYALSPLHPHFPGKFATTSCTVVSVKESGDDGASRYKASVTATALIDGDTEIVTVDNVCMKRSKASYQSCIEPYKSKVSHNFTCAYTTYPTVYAVTPTSLEMLYSDERDVICYGGVLTALITAAGIAVCMLLYIRQRVRQMLSLPDPNQVAHPLADIKPVVHDPEYSIGYKLYNEGIDRAKFETMLSNSTFSLKEIMAKTAISANETILWLSCNCYYTTRLHILLWLAAIAIGHGVALGFGIGFGGFPGACAAIGTLTIFWTLINLFMWKSLQASGKVTMITDSRIITISAKTRSTELCYALLTEIQVAGVNEDEGSTSVFVKAPALSAYLPTNSLNEARQIQAFIRSKSTAIQDQFQQHQAPITHPFGQAALELGE